MHETLVLTAADSGGPDPPVVWQAWPDEHPVLSGGVKLTLAWEPFRDGIMKSRAPEGFHGDQLFVNGARQLPARYPNFDPAVRILNGYAKDAFSPERAARWADPRGGFIHAMHRHEWGDFHYLITGKDAAGNVTYEGGWQNNRRMGMHGEDRFVANLFEDCLIHLTGRVEKQTAGVQIAMARDITVRHCSIHDVPRAGINIGDGCWGGHLIEFCDVFDTVKETGVPSIPGGATATGGLTSTRPTRG